MNIRVPTFDPERYSRHYARLGIFSTLAAGFLANSWSFPLLLLGIVAFTLACRSVHHGLLLFGPYTRMELVRIARKNRIILWRSVYAVILLGTVCVVFDYYLPIEKNPWFSFSPNSIERKDLANLGRTVFGMFVLWQSILILILTPGLTADVIAEEKEKKTLDFTLITDLRNREILLGKMIARVVYLFVPLLTALPFTALFTFFGGVDPNLMLAVFIASMATLFGYLGICAFCSVTNKNGKNAVSAAFGLMIGYFIVSGISWAILTFPRVAYFPSTSTWTSPIDMEDVIRFFNYGNPISALVLVVRQLETGGSVETVLWSVLHKYVMFHLSILFLCGWYAVNYLRIIASVQAGGAVATTTTTTVPKEKAAPKLPPVSDRPVLWRELFCESFWPRDWNSRMVFRLILLILVAVHLWTWVEYLDHPRTTQQIHHPLVRIFGTMLLLITLTHAASQAARSITKERFRLTLESLYLSDLGPREILKQKWWGAFLSVRFFLICWLSFWVMGCFIGSFGLWAIPLVAISTLIYNAFGVSMGIYWTVRAKTMREATGRLVSYTLFLSLIFGFASIICTYYELEPGTLLFVFWGVPPATLGFVGYQPRDWNFFWGWKNQEIAAVICGIVLSWVMYGFLAWKLWRAAANRFEQGIDT